MTALDFAQQACRFRGAASLMRRSGNIGRAARYERLARAAQARAVCGEGIA